MILYEVFEGAPPFKEQAAYDATELAAEEDCRLDMRSKTYPPGMWELIQRCWSTSPKERPLFDNIVQELQMMKDDFFVEMSGFIFRLCWTLSPLRIIRTARELLLLDMLSHSEVMTGLLNLNQPDSKSYLFSPQAG
ncbi:unnamed protein product [Sphagnum balticum]